MGGKQKRAAKLKRYKESQSVFEHKHHSSDSDHPVEYSQHHGGGGADSSSSDHLSENDLYRIKMEVLRQRQKKTKKQRIGSDWMTRILDGFCKPFAHWPTWPFALILGLLSLVGVFFLLRNMIQLFLPHNYSFSWVDRSQVYAPFRDSIPSPIYKMLVLTDYLFTANALSWDDISRILNRDPPRR